MVSDPQLLVEVSDCNITKLLTIVKDKNPRDLKVANDAFQTKFQIFFSVMVAKGSTSTHFVK